MVLAWRWHTVGASIIDIQGILHVHDMPSFFFTTLPSTGIFREPYVTNFSSRWLVEYTCKVIICVLLTFRWHIIRVVSCHVTGNQYWFVCCNYFLLYCVSVLEVFFICRIQVHWVINLNQCGPQSTLCFNTINNDRCLLRVQNHVLFTVQFTNVCVYVDVY